MSQSHSSNMTIDAAPTKELFIEMLTRDVALIPAIIDLADNCTDGARRLRGSKSWSGLQIDIVANESSFGILDNCGGIPVDLARKYAFKFGRPEASKPMPGEVGRFGIGMKRGLFKIGRHFEIRSTTEKSRFKVTIDVDKWATSLPWIFEFDNPLIEDRHFPASERGTQILVSKLRPQVVAQFADTVFIEELRHALTSKLEPSILRKLAVTLNGVSLKAHVRELVSDSALRPAKRQLKLRGPSGKSVSGELWCGLGKASSHQSARAEAGWYVFCNGRMLLEADKTAATGWGIEDTDSIPAYHPQFNDFRGFAYLDATDASDLPWNTTKTGLDTDHPVYRRIRQEMVAIARPVIDYFNQRKEENDAIKNTGGEARGTLQTLFDDAELAPITSIKHRSVFKVPPMSIRRKGAGPASQKISFERERAKADEVKENLGAKSWTQVGERVFDYYYKSECVDG